jgi:hypothetical protein
MLGDRDPRRARRDRSPLGPGDDDDDDDERPIGDPDDDEDYDDDEDEDEEPLRVDRLLSLVGKASALLDIASG